MTKSNRQHDNSNNGPILRLGLVRGVTSVIAAFLLAGCALSGRSPAAADAAEGCRMLEARMDESGMRDPVEMTGQAMIDVNQYRVRGRFLLKMSSPRELRFEYQSSGVMGGGREDVVFSYFADTLRVLDRERGEFYEGDQVRRLVEDGVGDDANLTELIHRLLLVMPACDRISDVRASDDGVSGRIDGDAFTLRLSGGRLSEARWPSPIATATRDRLEITYRREGAELVEMTLWMPEHRWRIRLRGEE